MKTSILITVFAFIFGSAFSQLNKINQAEKSEFKVYGNCGMCKSRIEKAATTDGVISALWNETTKILRVEYLPTKVKVETIHKNVAKVGHDTDKNKANDNVYNKLPECCKYERLKKQEVHHQH